MNILVIGNRDHKDDKKSFEVAKKLEEDYPNITFGEIKPNEDLNFSPSNDNETLIILDTVMGIDKPLLIDERNLDNIVLSKSTTVHDYDVGFQLKYLKKLGKISKFYILGIPLEKTLNKEDYFFIHSIFRKLVEHDIQGS